MNNINTIDKNYNFNNIISALQEDISRSGMTPPDNIEPGKFIRFSDNGKRNKNGWCRLFINVDGSAGAAFGNYKNVDQTWFYSPKGQKRSKRQREHFKQQIREAQEKAKQELEKKQKKAADKAQNIWDKASTPDPNHEYLIKKQIIPYGLRQSGKALLVPVLDDKNQIISLQEIFQNGSKKFFLGGKIKGGSFIIGDMQQGDVFLVCEGFATGATLHDASGKAVVVAFNSGNLEKIAHAFNKKYPDKELIICSDNDLATEKKTGKNPGKESAEKAASAIGVEICLCPVNSDFNDLMVDQGINAVQQALKKTHKINSEDWERLIPLNEDKAPDP